MSTGIQKQNFEDQVPEVHKTAKNEFLRLIFIY